MSDKDKTETPITYRQAEKLEEVVCKMAIAGCTSSEINLARSYVLHNFRKINETKPKFAPCTVNVIRVPESYWARLKRWISGGRDA